MSNKKELFTAPRWNDTSLPKVTGYVEVTEEERQQAQASLKKWLVKQGIMKETDEFDKSNEIDFDNLEEYVKNNIKHIK